MNADLRLRCASEIKRRLFPHTALTIKQLCYATGRSRTAVDAWLAGTASIKVEDLAEIARCLGDRSFLPAIFDIEPISAPALTVPSDNLRDIKQAMREVLAERTPQHFWITTSPTIQDAPAGHSEYVRRHLGLPESLEGDHVAYALRNLGWAAISLTGTSAELAYHATGIKADVAGKAASWLRAGVGTIASVKRTVVLKDGSAEAEGLSPERVADELSLVAQPLPRRPLMQRKPLDLAGNAFGEILRAAGEGPSRALNAIGGVGLAGRMSLYGVEGERVSCRWLGLELDLPRNAVGSDLHAWTDPMAGESVRRRVLMAKNEGPIYATIDAPLFGKWLTYDAITFPLDDGSVATVTQRLERAAA